jgi:hypothetical protein
MSCYGALGGTVYLQLMNDATGSELTFKKDPTGASTEIFKIKQNKIIHEFIKARSEFFINNGAFQINNTERSDPAEYCFETFNSDTWRPEEYHGSLEVRIFKNSHLFAKQEYPKEAKCNLY